MIDETTSGQNERIQPHQTTGPVTLTKLVSTENMRRLTWKRDS